MQNKLSKLIKVAGKQDAVELKIRNNATVTTLKAYNEEPTAARQRDLDAAQAGLEALVDRLWPRYFPEDDTFKNLLEVVAYLKSQGYKIAKSKAYKDAKDKQIRVQPDGSVLKRDADAYAKTLKLLGDPLKGLEAAQARKAELEIRRTELIVAALEHEQEVREGKYLLREEAEMVRADNARALFVVLSNGLLSAARRLLDAAMGDPNRLSEFVGAMQGEMERVANGLARMEEFEVVFERGAVDQSDQSDKSDRSDQPAAGSRRRNQSNQSQQGAK